MLIQGSTERNFMQTKVMSSMFKMWDEMKLSIRLLVVNRVLMAIMLAESTKSKKDVKLSKLRRIGAGREKDKIIKRKLMIQYLSTINSWLKRKTMAACMLDTTQVRPIQMSLSKMSRHKTPKYLEVMISKNNLLWKMRLGLDGT